MEKENIWTFVLTQTKNLEGTEIGDFLIASDDDCESVGYGGHME